MQYEYMVFDLRRYRYNCIDNTVESIAWLNMTSSLYYRTPINKAGASRLEYFQAQQVIVRW